MSIKEQLMADMKAAMKAKEEGKLALNTIRMARAHIRQAEIDNGHADFNDDQVLAVLRKEVKQRKETLSEIESSGREDLVEQTKAEIPAGRDDSGSRRSSSQGNRRCHGSWAEKHGLCDESCHGEA